MILYYKYKNSKTPDTLFIFFFQMDSPHGKNIAPELLPKTAITIEVENSNKRNFSHDDANESAFTHIVQTRRVRS